MMNSGWIILLFTALISAWYLGYYSRLRRFAAQKLNLPRDYLVGLNFLLNEEPDKAVDVFIKMLEVDSDTVETHLAVGKLFRRRGEVDRAIRIHQNLIARPNLDKTYREQSLFELGQDYLSAGVLDRAERIFLELVDIKEYAAPALRALLDIYQQEKEWENAIQTVGRLEVVARKNLRPVAAHYYCELAEIAIKKNQLEKANMFLQQAFDADINCVRASLLQAKLEMKKGEPKSALRSLKRVKHQNPDYLSESIDALASCYEALNEEKGLVTYLMKVLKNYPRVPVVLILSERIRKWKGDKVAANFVADYVRRYPSIRGLHLFINLYLSNTEGRAREDLLILQNLTKKLLADKPDYQCVSCGFSGKTLHWHCPGCKQWNSTKPVHSLEL
ncbi:MAG TPA: lipopolysaccharide assembly protein LapB [Gammaproteobacteria bacterium]|nr:lipopolysaccharide assembly protein LapB [Gammaproteobacteria bacterium]